MRARVAAARARLPRLHPFAARRKPYDPRPARPRSCSGRCHRRDPAHFDGERSEPTTRQRILASARLRRAHAGAFVAPLAAAFVVSAAFATGVVLPHLSTARASSTRVASTGSTAPGPRAQLSPRSPSAVSARTHRSRAASTRAHSSATTTAPGRSTRDAPKPPASRPVCPQGTRRRAPLYSRLSPHFRTTTTPRPRGLVPIPRERATRTFALERATTGHRAHRSATAGAIEALRPSPRVAYGPERERGSSSSAGRSSQSTTSGRFGGRWRGTHKGVRPRELGPPTGERTRDRYPGVSSK